MRLDQRARRFVSSCVCTLSCNLPKLFLRVQRNSFFLFCAVIQIPTGQCIRWCFLVLLFCVLTFVPCHRRGIFLCYKRIVAFGRIQPSTRSRLRFWNDDRSGDDEDQERSLIGDTAGCGATRFQNERVVASFGADQLSRAKSRLASRSCSQAARQTPGCGWPAVPRKREPRGALQAPGARVHFHPDWRQERHLQHKSA